MPEPVDTLIVQERGLCDYEPIWHEMQDFNASRTASTQDELWIVEHPPVFTLGLNGKTEHILNAGDIPVIPVDRGGQVTYHGPGQIVIYPLIDIKRRKTGVRELVTILEKSVIQLLSDYGINASNRKDAPGVYVNDAKIAALGLRIKRGGSYHGLSLNVDMDLEPFSRINPCGYEGMAVTQCRDHGITDDFKPISHKLIKVFAERLGYTIHIE
ncbi:MAG: lipoyl(octanoyl) transferase LipB [Gammaproteobacteria bacterium]|nr:lipoyl(octanoyl) transferase LipB [Gammaproteobacteria bacterium]